MIDIKKLLDKIQNKATKPSDVVFWDKEACGFVSRQNKEGTLPMYSKKQADEMISQGDIVADENGLPKVVPKRELTEEEKEKQKQARYKRRTVQLIRERYSAEDETAIQRQRDRKIEEFQEYDAYCEACKAKAKAEVYGNEV